MSLTESIVEDAARDWAGEQGFAVRDGTHVAPGEATPERPSCGGPILVSHLHEA